MRGSLLNPANRFSPPKNYQPPKSNIKLKKKEPEMVQVVLKNNFKKEHPSIYKALKKTKESRSRTN